MVRHQERRAVRSDDPDLVALLQVAEVVGGDAADRLAVVVLGDALHRERDVVVARPLAFARARDRVEPHMMRPARRVGSRRHDADRLAFEHGKRGAAEIEHDVADVGRRAVGGETVVAADGRDRRTRERVEVDVRVRGRPRRRHVAALARGRHGTDDGHFRGVLGLGARRDLALRGQAVPAELLGERVRPRTVDLPPVVDRAGRARRDALVAGVALRRVDDVVARVVRDRVDRAGLLAGVAANADLRVDQVLAQHRGGPHGSVHCRRRPS